MQIKTKLALNIIVVLTIIAAVVGTSIFGILFINGKLSYLTQRSTPYQMRTLEFQREIQSSTASLIKIGAASNSNELKSFRGEAEQAIIRVKDAQTQLKELGGNAGLTAYDELQNVATELFDTASRKLKLQEDAENAYKALGKRLQKANTSLSMMDKRMRGLQSGHANMFATALGDTSKFSAKARHVEEMRNLIKDLQLVFLEMQNAQKNTSLLIAKGKVNAVKGKIAQNEYQRTNKNVAEDARMILEKLDEFAKLQSIALGQKADVASDKADEAKAKAGAAGKEFSEKLNSFYMTLDQEATLANEKVGIESDKQGTIFNKSAMANSILISNSGLVSLGMSLEGLSIKLFTLNSAAQIDALVPELTGAFTKARDLLQALEKSLSKLQAKEELSLLKEVQGALTSVQSELLATDGIVATLKARQNAIEHTVKIGDRLREIVVKQAAKGKETVMAASGEQERAIASVNNIVTTSISLLVAISIAATITGILFGIWVFRSISRPLGQLIQVSDSVAGGNLQPAAIRPSNDEFGQVQASMEKMVENLRNMAMRISNSTTYIATSADELSATASQLKVSSSSQTMQIEQCGTAMTEINQVIQNISINAHQTADSAGKMKTIALDGREMLDATSQELLTFIDSIKKSVARVETLEEKSASINSIVNIIKEIATQTNLLALNAAIEAARAGEMGRGFAVVADNIRLLATRSTESADEISATIRSMYDEIQFTISSMQSEKNAIDDIVMHIEPMQKAMLEIVSCVEQVFDMVQAIATATEEQSATAESVNNNMLVINDITRQVSISVNHIKGASDNFAGSASELRQMVSWFKL